MRKLSELSEEEKMNLYRMVVKSWGKVSPRVLAEQLNIKIWALSAVVAKLRKAGIPLPKMIVTFMDEQFIEELKQIYSTRE